MRLRKRSSKIATLLAITTTVMAGSTAVASAVPATFSPSSGNFGMIMTSSLVVDWYTSPVTFKTYTCPPTSNNQQAWGTGTFSNTGSPLQGSVDRTHITSQLLCQDSTGAGVYVYLRNDAVFKAERTGSAFSLTSNSFFVQVPSQPAAWGGVQFSVPWTNPATPGGFSSITYNATTVAQALGGPVRLTGTFRVGPAGLTLS